MKAAFVTNPSKVTIRDLETPKIRAEEILVKMAACGICGSDVEKVFGRYGQPSTRLGHEPAGTILDVGSDVRGFDVGDRVFTHHHVPCYSCHYCKRGSETMCPTYYTTNLSPCGLSQEYVVPAWNVSHGGVLKLPDHVSFEKAALIEPLACCVRAWSKVSYGEGDSLAVFGAGPTGILHVMLGRSFEFEEIITLDMNRFRLEYSRRFGATKSIPALDPSRHDGILSRTGGRGVDLAIVATSSLGALQDALDSVRKGGTVVMFGVPSKGATINLDMSKIYSREITVVTSYAASDLDTRKALGLIASESLDVASLITHRYALADSQDAFDRAHAGEDAMKILVTG